uniref:NADH-ubiquinone oxidoreductase chain 4 n=1 Tax=Hirudinaria manillensis TaxID=1348078 RepID=X2C875_HIRMN|nr:NADH dehydrogenase subunit 4 [Hirudinaria manillensis]AGL34584.1 NADH dehydrogenase subunit 4 [Hirudinaria manillensis]
MLKLFLPMIGLLMFLNLEYIWIVFILIIMLSLLNFLFYYVNWDMVLVKVSDWSMIDSVSFLLIMLTMWVCIMMVICSFKYLYKCMEYNLFLKLTLLLMLVLLMSFSQVNIVLFYILFEFSLIPTMWLIMKWGYQPERLQASLYLVMYTVMGSLPMLCCILFMGYCNSSLSFFMWPVFVNMYFIESWWLMFLLGFLVKLPMYPFHLWLPKAHVEAPVSGSVILASILLKLGGYGIIRMGLLYPWLNLSMIPMLLSFSLLGGVVSSFICLRQIDLKSLIAYSSVSHMGLMLMGALSSCKIGLFGSMMMMVSHGFSSSALFIMANMNYDSCNSRSILVCKGTLLVVPMVSLFWFLFSIMNMAAPPFINLVSEISIMMSITFISSGSLVVIGMISFLTLCYSLNMYAVINHGGWSNYLGVYKMVWLKDYIMLIYMIVPSLLLLFKLN